jgi:hypothetical protein
LSEDAPETIRLLLTGTCWFVVGEVIFIPIVFVDCAYTALLDTIEKSIPNVMSKANTSNFNTIIISYNNYKCIGESSTDDKYRTHV